MFRTDLAIEAISEQKTDKGFTQKIRGKFFKITEVNISDEKVFNRPVGKYITLESSAINGLSGDYKSMVHELSEELEKIIPEGHIFVVGLGNDDITPDALGVLTVEKIIATRHMKNIGFEFFDELRTVTSIIPGVMGNTGIESSEVIKSVVERIKPNGIIVVDALACSDISRLGTTIQISDTGISPGSGVQNKRKELSKNTLGIPVIAIGIPTVIDLNNIVKNFKGENMLVTPKDIDKLVKHSADLISCSINLALQKNLTLEEIQELI